MLNRAELTIKNDFVDEINNDFVDEINNLLIAKFSGNEIKYISFDETIDQAKQSEHEDFLHTLHPPNLSSHELILKPNCPIMLLRNLNPAEGLCNGIRLICLLFTKHVIHARIAVGNFVGKEVFIS